MMTLKLLRGCNYKAFLITLLSILGLLEIMTKYNNEGSDSKPKRATESFHDVTNKSNEEDDVSSKSAKAKILLLAYARWSGYSVVTSFKFHPYNNISDLALPLLVSFSLLFPRQPTTMNRSTVLGAHNPSYFLF